MQGAGKGQSAMHGSTPTILGHCDFTTCLYQQLSHTKNTATLEEKKKKACAEKVRKVEKEEEVVEDGWARVEVEGCFEVDGWVGELVV